MWWVALVLRLAIGLAGAGLVAHAVTTNLEYWQWVHRSDADAQFQYVCGSVIADALKLLIPGVCAVYRVKLWRRPELCFVFALALVFSVWSGAGYTQMTQDAASAGGQVLETRRAALNTDIGELETKLQGLPPAGRAVPRVQAALAAAEAVAPKNGKSEACTGTWASRQDLCKPVFDLRAELATEQDRARLELALQPLRSVLAALPPRRDAEPAIASAGRFLRGLQFSVSDSALERTWSVIRLLLIELCPAAIAIFVLAPPPLPAAPIELGRPKRALRSPDRAGGQPPKTAGGPPAGAVTGARQPAVNLLALLHRAAPDVDGWINTTQRSLAEQLGLSPTEVNRQVAALAARGAVRVETSRRGTRLKVLAQSGKIVALRA